MLGRKIFAHHNIDLFYNRQRRHSKLGYLSLAEFIVNNWENDRPLKRYGVHY